MPHDVSSEARFEGRIRRSPFFEATRRHGASEFSIYNHMYFPGNFGTGEQNFWHLINAAVLSDVGVERQVEISGPDASRFVQLLTPRDLDKCAVGQCKYAVLTSNEGGIVNDPVLLRIERDRYWLSTADSDVLLWAKGVQTFARMDVTICEPDIAPLSLQGPRSPEIMKALFGSEIETLRYYWNRAVDLNGIPLVVSRTGFSGERGYELFLRDPAHGDRLWETIMEAGRPFDLRADTTSGIRRIEAGILVYQQDMTLANNPFEIGLERLVAIDREFDFVGKQALKAIAQQGVTRQLCGLELPGKPLANRNTSLWPLSIGDDIVGGATSVIYSPRLEKNIGIAMAKTAATALGTEMSIATADGARQAKVVPMPFFDHDKRIAKGLAVASSDGKSLQNLAR